MLWPADAEVHDEFNNFFLAQRKPNPLTQKIVDLLTLYDPETEGKAAAAAAPAGGLSA